MKLDNMDYLRQQIEASLGRSEELILLDKAKCGVFYRYPSEPPSPQAQVAKKRSPKERGGTFNSVRLKKYLGLGSKSKQKEIDEETCVQRPAVYLGELQRYDSYYEIDSSQFPLYHPRDLHRRKPSSYDSRTVSVGRSIHYPNMYSSVSVRSPQSRGTVYGMYPWAEHYLQTPSPRHGIIPNVNVLTEISPVEASEVFDCPCTCEESVVKSKRNRNACTCTLGTRSRWWTKRLPSRPSLFHGGGVGGDDEQLGHMEGIKKREGTAKANQYEQAPTSKSRLHRLSDLSSLNVSSSEQSKKDTFPRLSADFSESVPTRKSILECPVNPYELVSSHHESPKHQLKTKKALSNDYEDIEDRFRDDLSKDKASVKQPSKNNLKGRKSTSGAFRSISAGRRFRMDDDTENDAPDISLGGQRIRLFGTVNGTNKTIKRPSLPSFTERSTFDSLESKKSPINRKLPDENSNVTNRNLENTIKVVESPRNIRSKNIPKVLPNFSDDDWLDDEDEFHNIRKRSSKSTKSSLSPQDETRRLSVQNKTKIVIGGKSKTDISVSQNSDEIETDAEPTYVNVQNKSEQLDSYNQLLPCHTIISIGQDAESSSRSNSNKLNLRINFNDVPANLKPILKKSPFIESSTSSEAEGSETYSFTTSGSNPGEIAKQKQKKHVHFLSSRSLLSSSSDLISKECERSEGETSSSRELIDQKQEANVSLDDSDHETRSSESESFRGGGSSESEEEILSSSSSSSTQDLYDDGVSLVSQNTSVAADRSWSPESNFPKRNERGSSKNVMFAASSDDSTVVGTTKSDSDVKKLNLRRSLSERQVSVENSSRVDDNVYRSNRLSPVRSHSFQTVASMKLAKKAAGTTQSTSSRELSFADFDSSKNSIPGNASAQLKGSLSGGDTNQLSTFANNGSSNRKRYSKSPSFQMKYVDEDTNHQPVYQNSCNTSQSQMVASIIAKCNHKNIRTSNEAKDTKHVSSPTAYRRTSMMASQTPSSSRKFGEDSRVEVTFHRLDNNFDHKSFDKRSLSSDELSSAEQNKISARTNSTNALEIAKMKAIPKFLPRPTYVGKHVPVCSLYSDDSKFIKQEAEKASSGWSSEDDLYADGSSHVQNLKNDSTKRFNTEQSLPPVPIDRRRQSPVSKSDDSDDNGIYEQIAEPLYEEVPDTISYSSGTSGTGSMGHPRKSIFEGASKTEILSYLEDAKERGVENIPSTEEPELLQEADVELENEATDELENQKSVGTKRNHRNRISNLSNLSDSSQTSEESYQNDNTKINDTRYGHCNVEVERNDSGVGSETSKPSRLRRQLRVEESSEQICVDCDFIIEKNWNQESDSFYVEPLVCKKCCKKRCERKEIILEFVETEIKYGRDLRIIKEEFHRPMLVAGLLAEELLNNIFLNLDQLIEVNDKFTEKLKDALDIAVEQGDEDYNTVNVGKIFLDSSSMLPAFETYCVRQGTASLLLTNLEKEKELLRIFLKVSQMENTLLRRLNLNSFLMVPVQRVTKYPLLINRLHKVTPHHHQDREALREAQLKIELHLEHINQQAKDLSGMNIWRRISNMSNPQRRNLLEPVIGNIKMRKMALEVLQWNNNEVRFVMEGRLQYTQINENLWTKRDKSLKLTSIHGLLITLGNPNSDYRPDLADREFIFPRNTGIREATLVLIKEKNNRFSLVKDPLPLQRCVICCDPEVDDMFEVQEFTTKEAYLIKGDDIKDTQEWLKMLRYHAKDLGAWRRRRNALANIMINGMAARREWL